MRSAKEVEHFPYTMKTICYIEVDNSGGVSQIGHNKTDMLTAYEKAMQGDTALYAVWPGQWRSDLFIIDDLNALAKAFELKTPVHD